MGTCTSSHLVTLDFFFQPHMHPHLEAVQYNHGLNSEAHEIWINCSSASKQCCELLDIPYINSYFKVRGCSISPVATAHCLHLSVGTYLADDGCCPESHIWRSRGSSQSSCSVFVPERTKVRKRKGQSSQLISSDHTESYWETKEAVTAE